MSEQGDGPNYPHIEVITLRADAFSKPVPNLTVRFCKPVNGAPHTQADYRQHAESIVRAIERSAPGGLVDALFAVMAARQASILAVPRIAS